MSSCCRQQAAVSRDNNPEYSQPKSKQSFPIKNRNRKLTILEQFYKNPLLLLALCKYFKNTQSFLSSLFIFIWFGNSVQSINQQHDTKSGEHTQAGHLLLAFGLFSTLRVSIGNLRYGN